MKRIITSIVCCMITVSMVQATSFVDAMRAKGITECTDKTASNYKAYAPCMYIRKSIRVSVPSNNNYYNHNDIYNNTANNAQISQLIDTSTLVQRYNDTRTNTRSYYDEFGPAPIYPRNTIWDLVDTSDLSKFGDARRYTNKYGHQVQMMTTIPQVTTSLASWFNKGFNSVQSIGDIVLYGRDGQYIAVNYRQNQIVFETTPGQTVQYMLTGAQEQTMIIMSNSTTLPTSYSIYLVTSGGTMLYTGATTVRVIKANERDNVWGEDVVIVSSYNNDNTIITFRGEILQSKTNSAQTTTTTNQDTTIIPTRPTITTVKPIALTYNINYTLGRKDVDGNYVLTSAKCITNGTVEALWIDKRMGDTSFGLGIEINNTFGNQTYKVKSGDKLCCRVINTRASHYTQAGGCEIIK